MANNADAENLHHMQPIRLDQCWDAKFSTFPDNAASLREMDIPGRAWTRVVMNDPG